MSKRSASKWISEQAQKEIQLNDRIRFIEVVELGLCGLHEGNIARYRLRPCDFLNWQKIWESVQRQPLLRCGV
jgi:hypothetical protein